MSELRTALVAIHRHLSITATRPVDRTTSRWLGEAEAVAEDLAADPGIEPSVAFSRLRDVETLLDHVSDLEDAIADHHVRLARRLIREVRASRNDEE